MKAAAIVLCVVAVVAMATVIRDMVVGRDEARRGWLLRAVAVVAFVAAVVLGALAGR